MDLELIADEDERLEDFEAEFNHKLAEFEQTFSEIFPIEFGVLTLIF